MRSTPLRFALASLLVSSGAAQAQVNLIQKPHHVYLKPKPAEQTAGSTPANTAVTPATPAPAAPAAPAPSASASPPATPPQP